MDGLTLFCGTAPLINCFVSLSILSSQDLACFTAILLTLSPPLRGYRRASDIAQTPAHLPRSPWCCELYQSILESEVTAHYRFHHCTLKYTYTAIVGDCTRLVSKDSGNIFSWFDLMISPSLLRSCLWSASRVCLAELGGAVPLVLSPIFCLYLVVETFSTRGFDSLFTLIPKCSFLLAALTQTAGEP